MYVLTRVCFSCSSTNGAWVLDFETAEACCDPKSIITSITFTKTPKWMSKVSWCVLPLSCGGTGRDIEAAEQENHLQHACVWLGYCSHHVREDCRVEGGRGGMGAPKQVDGRCGALVPSPYMFPCVVLHGHILRHGGEILRARRDCHGRPGSPGRCIRPWWERHNLLLFQ